MNLSRFLLAALVIALVTSADAQIYRSVDANGRTVFSDAPPPTANTNVSTVKTASPPASVVQPQTDWAQKDREIRQRMQAKANAERVKEGQENIRAAECRSAQTAQKELDRIEGKHTYRRDSNGERVWIGDDERARIAGNVKQSVEKNCN